MRSVGFILVMLATMMSALAQHRGRGGNGGRGHHAHGRTRVVHTRVVHKHPHRYVRSRVVVVRPRRCRTVTVMPAGHMVIVHRGNNFYFDRGVYYRSLNGGYSVVAAPVGIRIRVLPVGFRRIIVANQVRYYYQGTYYQQVGEEYETLEPEIGSAVPELPEDNVDEVTLDGQTYYEYDNMLYKKIVTNEGVQYEVVGKLE